MTDSHTLSVAQALTQAASQGLARVDAQMLLLHVCGQATHARAWLITHDSAPLSREQLQQWQQLLAVPGWQATERGLPESCGTLLPTPAST